MTTQAVRTQALDHLRRHVQQHGMPQSPQGWYVLVEEALSLPEPEQEPDTYTPKLEEVARRARYVFDQWVIGAVTRQNGMNGLERALRDAGF